MFKKAKMVLTLGTLITVFLPFIGLANGGDQRIAGGYMVSLSRSPFTPIAGTKTAMIATFVDLKTGYPIQEDLLVSLRIAEGRGSRDFMHETKDIPVQGGILEYSYTFENPGIHEIYFDFTLSDDPAQKAHHLLDFLIDVQKPEDKKKIDTQSLVLGASLGTLIGLAAGWAMSRKRITA
jgi:hypothetical protein